MKYHSLSAALVLSFFAATAFAQTPSAAPAAGADQKGGKAVIVSGAAKAEVKPEMSKSDEKAAKKAAKKAEKAEKKAEKQAEKQAKKVAETKVETKAVVAPVTAATPAKPATPATPAKPATPATPATPAVAATAAAPAAAKPMVAGTSNTKVWVNTESKVYHCPGTRYYGKTKVGSYMTETEAASKGSHADHGKVCAK